MTVFIDRREGTGGRAQHINIRLCVFAYFLSVLPFLKLKNQNLFFTPRRHCSKSDKVCHGFGMDCTSMKSLETISLNLFLIIKTIKILFVIEQINFFISKKQILMM